MKAHIIADAESGLWMVRRQSLPAAGEVRV